MRKKVINIIFLAFCLNNFSVFSQTEENYKLVEQYLCLDSLTADTLLLNEFNPFEISEKNKYYFFKTNFLNEFEFWKVPKLSTNYFTILNSNSSILNIKFNKSSFPPTTKMLNFNAAYMYRHTYKFEIIDDSIVISILNVQDNNYFFYCKLIYINKDEIDVPLEIRIK